MMRFPTRPLPYRPGLSLLETLIAAAIVAVAIGLVLPAVQKSREAALRLQSENNLRQIGLGLHHFNLERGRLPGFVYPLYSNSADNPPLSAILPYIGIVPGPSMPLYIDPADPTRSLQYPNANPLSLGNSGYAINKPAFDGLPDLASGFPDGTTNTIAVAEHYERCGPNARYNFIFSLRYSRSNDPASLNDVRRASFADAYYGDVVPVPDSSGSVQPSRPGATFQVRPLPDQCDPSIPQTPYSGGMPVLLFDGSARTLAPGIAPAVFWAAVTRDGGEVATLE